MIYKIKNKKIQVMLKNEVIELPIKLKNKINENFENIKKTGANIWNGEVLCVSECNIKDDKVEMICKKSDYAHYLYGERIGCPKGYECKNLSAGCLLETIDEYYIVGEKIEIEQTIIREAREELNIDLNDKKSILYNKISYIYVSEDNEQPGVQLLSKAKTKMTAEEVRKYFESYYKYLKENNLEGEFRELHFLKKENGIEELKELKNPKRNYLIPLLKIDMKGK